MTSVLFTYPLEIIRVRMAFHTRSMDTGNFTGKPTFLRAASEIYHEVPKHPPSPPPPPPSSHAQTIRPSMILPSSSSSSATLNVAAAQTIPSAHTLFTRFPILKFYRGFTVTLTGMIPYAGTSFLTWGYLRSRLLPPPSSSSSTHTTHTHHPLLDLTTGALSGALSQTISYPFEVIRRRMQVGGLTHPDRWMRWGETVKSIWRGGGVGGFYVGLGVGYAKIVPMTAVSYMVWQWGKEVLGI